MKRDDSGIGGAAGLEAAAGVRWRPEKSCKLSSNPLRAPAARHSNSTNTARTSTHSCEPAPQARVHAAAADAGHVVNRLGVNPGLPRVHVSVYT